VERRSALRTNGGPVSSFLIPVLQPSPTLKNIRFLSILLASAAVASAQSSTADVTAGETALSNQDPATANADFAAAVAADPTNQTAQALLGFTDMLALPGQSGTQQFMNGLGISAAGRNIYNFTATATTNAQGQVVLPAGYNLSTFNTYLATVVLPALTNASASFSAVTSTSFVLNLTAAETSATAVTIDYGDILMCNALVNADACLIEVGEGENLDANLANILQLAQGKMLTLQDVIGANPNLLLPGSPSARTAAQASLLNAIQLYQAASAFIRARPPGVSRLFMLSPADAAAEAAFRTDLVQVQQAMTGYVPIGTSGHTGTLAPFFTGTWSARAELPPTTSTGFDLSQIPDPTVGGVVTGFTAASLAQLLGGPPSITLQPSSQNVASGSTVVFTVGSDASSGATYQWYLNGSPIAGATGASLVINNADSAKAGTYYALASNSAGSTYSTPASLTLTSTSNPGRLTNLSILSKIQGSLSMGFVTGGAGTSGSQSLLIRSVGPSLTGFGITSGYLPDPVLTVIQQSNQAVVATDTGWGSNQTAVTAADSATGAFALSNPASLDSALVASLPSVGGGYSATVAGKSGDGGYALTEVYDDTPAGTYTSSTPRLVNLSCLTQIPTGGTLDLGFVIGGATSKTLLVRASGPALATLYGTGGTMPDPMLQVSPLSNSSNVLAVNAGWGGNAQVASIAATVGAFAFPSASSLDSAVVVTLAPNVPYTVQVASASGLGGQVLVEIYEVP